MSSLGGASSVLPSKNHHHSSTGTRRRTRGRRGQRNTGDRGVNHNASTTTTTTKSDEGRNTSGNGHKDSCHPNHPESRKAGYTRAGIPPIARNGRNSWRNGYYHKQSNATRNPIAASHIPKHPANGTRRGLSQLQIPPSHPRAAQSQFALEGEDDRVSEAIKKIASEYMIVCPIHNPESFTGSAGKLDCPLGYNQIPQWDRCHCCNEVDNQIRVLFRLKSPMLHANQIDDPLALPIVCRPWLASPWSLDLLSESRCDQDQTGTAFSPAPTSPNLDGLPGLTPCSTFSPGGSSAGGAPLSPTLFGRYQDDYFSIGDGQNKEMATPFQPQPIDPEEAHNSRASLLVPVSATSAGSTAVPLSCHFSSVPRSPYRSGASSGSHLAKFVSSVRSVLKHIEFTIECRMLTLSRLKRFIQIVSQARFSPVITEFPVDLDPFVNRDTGHVAKMDSLLAAYQQHLRAALDLGAVIWNRGMYLRVLNLALDQIARESAVVNDKKQTEAWEHTFWDRESGPSARNQGSLLTQLHGCAVSDTEKDRADKSAPVVWSDDIDVWTSDLFEMLKAGLLSTKSVHDDNVDEVHDANVKALADNWGETICGYVFGEGENDGDGKDEPVDADMESQMEDLIIRMMDKVGLSELPPDDGSICTRLLVSTKPAEWTYLPASSGIWDPDGSKEQTVDWVRAVQW